MGKHYYYDEGLSLSKIKKEIEGEKLLLKQPTFRAKSLAEASVLSSSNKAVHRENSLIGECAPKTYKRNTMLNEED